MQHRCPVSGLRQICPESTWKQSKGLSFRELTHGQGSLSVSYNNNNNNNITTGNICSSARITRHCDDTGDTSGKKPDTIPAPWGSHSRERARRDISRDCMSRCIHVNLCVLQTHSVMKVHPLCPGYRWASWVYERERSQRRARIRTQLHHTFKNCTQCSLSTSLFSWAPNSCVWSPLTTLYCSNSNANGCCYLWSTLSSQGLAGLSTDISSVSSLSSSSKVTRIP